MAGEPNPKPRSDSNLDPPADAIPDPTPPSPVPRVVGPGFHGKVHTLVRRVPAGRVTTYGDIAAALGARSVARHVGWALAAYDPALVVEPVPWHRVVNGRGRISFPLTSGSGDRQRRLLQEDGVEVTDDGRIVGFAGRRWGFPPVRPGAAGEDLSGGSQAPG